MDEKKRLIKNTGIIALGNISTKMIGFLLLPLYTSVLSTEEYGTIDYITTISMFLVPFISMLMDEAVFRFLIDCRNDEERKKSFINYFYTFNIQQCISNWNYSNIEIDKL